MKIVRNFDLVKLVLTILPSFLILSAFAASFLLVFFVDSQLFQVFFSFLVIILFFVIAGISIKVINDQKYILDLLTDGMEHLKSESYDFTLPATKKGKQNELISIFNEMAQKMEINLSQMNLDAETLSVVLDNMDDSVMVVNSSNEIDLMNNAALSLFNFTGQSFKRRRLSDVVRYHQILQLVNSSRESNETLNLEIELFDLSKTFFVSSTPLNFQNEKAILLNFHDLSDLYQLDNTRREFVSNVSHELRSPITSISVMLETLESGAINDEIVRDKYLERISGEVTRMTLLINDLLELSRIESGVDQIEMDHLNLVSIIEESINMSKNRFYGDHPEIRNLADSEIVVNGTKDYIIQIFVNLIENAIKYTDQHGVINISAAIDGQFVKIDISDSGQGIDAEHIPHLFERFYKADKSRSDSGTGLGLAIVKHLTQTQGGSVSVTSQIGEGSVFSFTLQLAQ